MNKKYLLLFGILMALALLIGLGTWWRQSHPPEDLGTIKLGYDVWPGVLPYMVAYEKGYFKEQGLKVFLIQMANYESGMKALIEGQIDCSGSLVLIDVMYADNRGADLQVVGVSDYSNGSDGIIAKPGIKSIVELRNKRIGVELGTLGEYLLFAALEQKGLSFADIRLVDLDAQNAAQAFLEGKVDGAVSYGPNYIRAIGTGKAVKIFSSADVPGLIVDTLVFRGSYIKKHTQQIRAMLRAYFKAVDYIASHQQECYVIGGRWFKISSQDFEAQYRGLQQLSFKDNLVAFSYAAGYSSLYGNGRFANGYLLKTGKVKEKLNLDKIIHPEFFWQVYRERLE